MRIEDTLIGVFVEVFHLADPLIATTLTYRQLGWDSTTHMILISKVEETFHIVMETEHVFAFKSFSKGVDVVRKLLEED